MIPDGSTSLMAEGFLEERLSSQIVFLPPATLTIEAYSQYDRDSLFLQLPAQSNPSVRTLFSLGQKVQAQLNGIIGTAGFTGSGNAFQGRKARHNPHNQRGILNRELCQSGIRHRNQL